MKDKDFLEFIAERLVKIYGENPNTDFILRLRTMADNMGSVESLVQGASDPHPDVELIIRAALGECAVSIAIEGMYNTCGIDSLMVEPITPPRTYEEGHWYPVTSKVKGKDLAVYINGVFLGHRGDYFERDLEWIGESLGDIKFGEDE